MKLSKRRAYEADYCLFLIELCKCNSRPVRVFKPGPAVMKL